jgi:hypothetical protein
MYITLPSIKRTLGKYIEMQDLYIGLSMFLIFLIIFSFTNLKMFSLVYLTVGIFLFIPINVSKKNRMYKLLMLFLIYMFKKKEYLFFRKEEKEKWQEKLKMRKI